MIIARLALVAGADTDVATKLPAALEVVSKLGPVATVVGVLWAVLSYQQTNRAKAVQAAARVICVGRDSGIVIKNLSDEVITNVLVTQEGESPRVDQDFVEKNSELLVHDVDSRKPVKVTFWGPHGWWWRTAPGLERPERLRPWRERYRARRGR